MNILHFSTSDYNGGAAKASYRLHAALRGAGLSSHMIVRHKLTDDADVRPVGGLPRWQSRLQRVKRRVPMVGAPLTSEHWFNFDSELDIDPAFFFSQQPQHVDIISLHWITGLLRTAVIAEIYNHYRRPIIWTMMDQEPVTGGCHYSMGCLGYMRQCGHCPVLGSKHQHDPSRAVWRRKFKHLHNLPITFVAPTSWVEGRIRESSLFKKHRVERIPLALDTTVFRLFDRNAARDLLHVPHDKRVIFFGSASLTDPRKGMAYLHEALHRLLTLSADGSKALQREDVFLLIAGHASKEFTESLPFPSRQVGYLRDDLTLALAYQAADVFVCPSTEDAGPMMIPESMLCGTPVVAFDSGGAPDLITTMQTGYLAAYKDSADLARGIRALLTSDGLPAIGVAAHEAATRLHVPSTVAAQYLGLYRSLIEAP